MTRKEYKVGDKVIWIGRTGWGRPAPWRIDTIIKVTPAGRVRTRADGPLYNASGSAVGGAWRTSGQIEPWSEERECALQAEEAEFNAAMEFREICETLSRCRDNAEAARLLALMPKEYRVAAGKEPQS